MTSMAGPLMTTERRRSIAWVSTVDLGAARNRREKNGSTTMARHLFEGRL